MRLVVLVTLTVLAAAPVFPAAPPPGRATDVKATLTGEVLELGLARPGDAVRDGDALVHVRTTVGRGVAARAPHDGVVVEVLVRPGQMITQKGTVVLRLTPR